VAEIFFIKVVFSETSSGVHKITKCIYNVCR